MVNFAGPDTLKGALLKSLKVIQPSCFFGVPCKGERHGEDA